MMLVDKLAYWDDEISRNVRSFVLSNDQVKGAYEVQNKLKSRIERVREEYLHSL